MHPTFIYKCPLVKYMDDHISQFLSDIGYEIDDKKNLNAEELNDESLAENETEEIED